MFFFFTKYGKKELLVSSIIMLSLVVALIYLFPPAIPLPILGLCFVAYFFRDPQRHIPENIEYILAPADGKVVEISEVYEEDFLKEKAIKIGIFMSLLNVHINRAPCVGQVEMIKYQKGKFHNAQNPKSSLANENNSIGIVDHQVHNIKVLVKQIAGVIARRIVCDCKPNDQLEKGQQIGMIKFGSRVELFLPKTKSIKLNVKLKDKVKAGETILAIINDEVQTEKED